MAYKSYKGWYTIKNKEKFIPPLDNYMKSFNESTHQVEYKSGLEYKSFKYCDLNPNIERWSVEPFPIQYIKPTDDLLHRYFPDLLIQFTSGNKFLVEVKSLNETIPPKKSKKVTQKSILRYKKALQVYQINDAKWTAAIKFSEANNMKFIFLTDVELKNI